MGTPKVALPFGKSTILESLIAELCGSFDELLVVAAPARAEGVSIEYLLRTAPPSVRLLRDRNAYEGPAVALALGLNAAAHDIAFACSCDLPLLRAQVVRALREMLHDYEAVIPCVAGKPQPLCAFYRRSAAALIEKQVASGERRLTQVINFLRAYRPQDQELRQLDPDLRSFLNINTPEDYNRALAIKRSLDGSSL
jgi:molybdenum cofactor guanylyltransferase